MRNTPTRRAVLRGASATLALPLLESFSHALPAAERPLRLAFVYVPNGMHMPAWLPPSAKDRAQTGRQALPSELPPILKHIERHRDNIALIEGLTSDKARANGDGPGDHARA